MQVNKYIFHLFLKWHLTFFERWALFAAMTATSLLRCISCQELFKYDLWQVTLSFLFWNFDYFSKPFWCSFRFVILLSVFILIYWAQVMPRVMLTNLKGKEKREEKRWKSGKKVGKKGEKGKKREKIEETSATPSCRGNRCTH